MATGDEDTEQPGTEEQVETPEAGEAEVAETEETSEDETEGTEEEENAEGAEAETEEAGEGEEDPAEKPTKRSASETIRALKAERNAERARAEKLTEERAFYAAQVELQRQNQSAQQTEAQKRAEEQKLALLDPSERANYESAKRINNLEFQLNQMRLQQADDRDRANFHAKAAHDPTYEKYSDTVEKMYQEGLARGVQASREDLHSYLLGKELKKDMAAKITKKREAAGKRIASVTTKPVNGKGDVAGAKKGKSEEDRLRGMLI